MAARRHDGIRLLGAIALAVFATACASGGATPKPFPMPGQPAAARPPSTPTSPAERPADLASGTDAPAPSASAVDALLRTALDLRGRPYRNGGSTPDGFDCSGFTQYVFARHGLRLPREVREQFRFGTPVPDGDLQPGDLVFFTTTEPGASHVGIALDAQTFVHAPSSNGVVRVERLTLPYWTRRFVGVRRLQAN